MDEDLSLWMNAVVYFYFGSSIVEKTYFSYYVGLAHLYRWYFYSALFVLRLVS